MIGYLKGRVMHLMADYCLLDVGGVGYRVFVAGSTRSRLRLGEEAALFTHLAVREDALTLYGFSTSAEYDFFQQLISVAGIGPKVAQNILAASTVEAICRAIGNKEAAVLTKLPGVGKKTAERLILELKDKISYIGGNTGEADMPLPMPEPVGGSVLSQAAAALSSLNFSQSEIAAALKRTGEKATVELTVAAALKELGTR